MLLPKSYAGSLQVALSTQTTTHTAQQPQPYEITQIAQ